NTLPQTVSKSCGKQENFTQRRVSDVGATLALSLPISPVPCCVLRRLQHRTGKNLRPNRKKAKRKAGAKASKKSEGTWSVFFRQQKGRHTSVRLRNDPQFHPILQRINRHQPETFPQRQLILCPILDINLAPVSRHVSREEL